MKSNPETTIYVLCWYRKGHSVNTGGGGGGGGGGGIRVRFLGICLHLKYVINTLSIYMFGILALQIYSDYVDTTVSFTDTEGPLLTWVNFNPDGATVKVWE